LKGKEVVFDYKHTSEDTLQLPYAELFRLSHLASRPEEWRRNLALFVGCSAAIALLSFKVAARD
jgi:hypothetical protein